MEYELWDKESSNMLFFTADTKVMVEMLQELFDMNALSPRLDELLLLVYNAEEEVQPFEGVEAIEGWLTENE